MLQRFLTLAACAPALLAIFAYPQRAVAEEIDAEAQKMIEAADAVRFPREPFQVDVVITSSGDTDAHRYRVLAKGTQNTIVQTLEPATEKGQALLMRARDLWIFLPDVSQAVRLSLSQRLSGQVANGDLARANFAGDYAPRLVRTETLDGEETNVLELSAVDRSVAYNRVLYWLRKSDNAPLKAEFYAVSGRLLKTCRFEDYQTMVGRKRPARLVMVDGLKKDDTSILEYRNMQIKDLPDRMFTKDYLKKLE